MRTIIRCLIFFTVALCALCLCAAPVLAQEAVDITPQCDIQVPEDWCSNPHDMLTADLNLYAVFDGPYYSYPYVDIKTPDDTPAYGLYIVWANAPGAWSVTVPNPDWQNNPEANISQPFAPPTHLRVLSAGGQGFLHEYVPLDGLTEFRIQHDILTDATFGIAQLHVLSQGELPAWVQTWQEAPDAADLMVMVAHPDDELIFLGGTIPYYAGVQQKKTVVVYATYGRRVRRSELLNALWVCGVRTYPVWGDFPDVYAFSYDYVLGSWGEDRLRGFITEQIRKFRPKVVVTLDVEGESGHGAHKSVSRQTLAAVQDYIWDENSYPNSAARYGVCDVPKLYMHNNDTEKLIMDAYGQPQQALGGLSPVQVAALAFWEHISQQSPEWNILSRDKYDNFAYGLVYTLVGYDEAKNDLFEHIDQWDEL
jgi:hypothetical protein